MRPYLVVVTGLLIPTSMRTSLCESSLRYDFELAGSKKLIKKSNEEIRCSSRSDWIRTSGPHVPNVMR